MNSIEFNKFVNKSLCITLVKYLFLVIGAVSSMVLAISLYFEQLFEPNPLIRYTEVIVLTMGAIGLYIYAGNEIRIAKNNIKIVKETKLEEVNR